jgi:hypothetical protein
VRLKVVCSFSVSSVVCGYNDDLQIWTVGREYSNGGEKRTGDFNAYVLGPRLRILLYRRTAGYHLLHRSESLAGTEQRRNNTT